MRLLAAGHLDTKAATLDLKHKQMKARAGIATWIDTVVPNIRSRWIAHSQIFNSRPGMAHLQFPEAIIRYRIVGDGPRTLVLATDPRVVVER
jgi:hypothetical protein